MTKNIYKKWEPVEDLPEEIYLQGLHDDYEGFRLLFKGLGDTSRMLRMTFSPILAYSGISESDLILYPRVDGSNNLGRWGLFKVENSDYLDWYHNVSQGIHLAESIVHYAIYTHTDCLDLLASTPPTIEWLN